MSDTVAASRRTQDVIDRTRRAAPLFIKDIETSTEDMLGKPFGGKARSGYDLIFEVATINRFVAMAASGQNAGAEPLDNTGPMRAPESLQTKEAALENFKASVEEVCEALANCPDERIDTTMQTPFGETPISVMMGIVPVHIMYHSGQLNYIQTLYGDDKFHWFED